uniref:MPN domain-containing protein n=1 Tax=Anopheles epiroticus TaxID=199890 RepID=A0A182PNW5_9DIPT
MSEVMFDARAYCKIMLHSAKYPHLAVNGLLLAENGKPKTIVDAVPLFHQCLHVSPMAEVALVQVEAKASQKGRQIVGYYVGCENFYDNHFERAPGIRIAEKIAELNSDACIAVIDNRAVSINMRYPALRIWQHRDNRWSKAKCVVENERVTFDVVSCLLQRGAAKELHDYDNYLDNTQHDWDNVHLNGDLKQILAIESVSSSSRNESNTAEDDCDSLGAKRYTLRRKAYKREVKKKIFRIAGQDIPDHSGECDDDQNISSTQEKSTVTLTAENSKGNGARNIHQSMLQSR